MHAFKVLAICFVLSVVAACDSGGSDDPNAVGPRGAISKVASGAQVEIPAGALSETIIVTIRPTGAGDHLPTGIIAVGPAITFEPEGQTFAKPVTVTVPATNRATGIHWRPGSGGGWTKLEGEVFYDSATGLISGQTSHFSEFVATIGIDE